MMTNSSEFHHIPTTLSKTLFNFLDCVKVLRYGLKTNKNYRFFPKNETSLPSEEKEKTNSRYNNFLQEIIYQQIMRPIFSHTYTLLWHQITRRQTHPNSIIFQLSFQGHPSVNFRLHENPTIRFQNNINLTTSFYFENKTNYHRKHTIRTIVSHIHTRQSKIIKKRKTSKKEEKNQNSCVSFHINRKTVILHINPRLPLRNQAEKILFPEK